MARVLVLSHSAADRRIFEAIEEGGLWTVITTESVRAAIAKLEAETFPVVVLDRDVPGQEWRETLVTLADRSPQSCFLLASRVSDEFLWKEVVKHGGYDVLPKPLDPLALRLALLRALYYATMPLRTA